IEEAMTAEQWYAGVIDSIVSDLGLDFDDYAWWEQYGHLSLVNRFSKFVDEVLLRLVPGPLVIFIDEIDRILSLPFKVNGFFAVIRECYNKRADIPKYQRLSFALLGVATPSDLIEDKRSTPFNVGQAIALTGFTYEEAQPLVPGLAAAVTQPDAVLREILHWTGGQPFLTQKICDLVAQRELATVDDSKAWVERLVRGQVISNWESNDEPEHLRTIRDRLLRDEQTAARQIGLYQQIWQEDGLPVDVTNPAHIELRLSGAVVERDRQLQVYNPIYAAIFNLAWAAQTLANLRPYSIAISAWLSADRQDKSRLLRGEALSEAKHWSEDKVLPPEDYAFLAASQELVTAETEEARQTLAQANQTLAEANQEAIARTNSANRRLRIGSGILVGTVALFAFTGLYTTQRISQAQAERNAAQSESQEAKQEIDLAQQRLAEADKAQAQLQAETEQAQSEVAAAEEKSGKIEEESQRRIGVAKQEVDRAAVEMERSQKQAQAAQAATQTAEQEQRLAQQKAGEAAQLAGQAEQDKTAAQQAKIAAEEKQDIVQAGTELEREGIALLRRPSEEFRDIDTLLDALDLGERLQALMQRDTKAFQSVGIEEYPAISPMLALRTTTKSVLETSAFDGEFRDFSDDGQRLVTYSGSDNRTRLYDLAGNEIAAFDGEFSSFSDDGQRLVTYSDSDRRTRLYDLAGNEMRLY
ncbi:MAG: AAA-like domain-containing protein, partial [Phormidesmis sp.]